MRKCRNAMEAVNGNNKKTKKDDVSVGWGPYTIRWRMASCESEWRESECSRKQRQQNPTPPYHDDVACFGWWVVCLVVHSTCFGSDGAVKKVRIINRPRLHHMWLPTPKANNETFRFASKHPKPPKLIFSRVFFFIFNYFKIIYFYFMWKFRNW